jgi:hypothetical protein
MQRAFVWIQEDPGFHPGLFSAVPTGTGSFSVGLPSTVRWATARRPYRDWFPLLAAGVVCPLRTAVLLKQNGQHPTIEIANLEKRDQDSDSYIRYNRGQIRFHAHFQAFNRQAGLPRSLTYLGH